MSPDNNCTKETDKIVLEVLQSKHPNMRKPDMSRDDLGTFEKYKKTPGSLPIFLSALTIEEVVGKLSGSAGPSGVTALDLQHWCTRFGVVSQHLREELAEIYMWISNTNPPFALYRALRACRGVALDKKPGTRPVGVGELFM